MNPKEKLSKKIKRKRKRKPPSPRQTNQPPDYHDIEKKEKKSSGIEKQTPPGSPHVMSCQLQFALQHHSLTASNTTKKMKMKMRLSPLGRK